MNKNFVIIGGGVAGMTIAHILSKKYKDIIIIEKNNELGGKVQVTDDNGYIQEH